MFDKETMERVARAIEPETFELPRINLNKWAYDRAYKRATAALAAAWEWKPIETAPRDGTHIFGWRKHAVFPRRMFWNKEYEWWECSEMGHHLYDVILWMPLPAAPEVTP